MQQLARQIVEQANVTDPAERMRIQSNAMRTGTLLQNLGALLLELGRATMTLRVGQTPVCLLPTPFYFRFQLDIGNYQCVLEWFASLFEGLGRNHILKICLGHAINNFFHFLVRPMPLLMLDQLCLYPHPVPILLWFR